jgi:hypothetical protein
MINIKYKTYKDEIEDYQSILFHKNIAFLQRTAYSKQLKNLEELRNKILIELDFKQKFVIGMSPRQVSREFYNQTMRTCLGNYYEHNCVDFKNYESIIFLSFNNKNF